MRKEVEVIKEKVKNIEKVELNFSGFVTPDFRKVNKERKEERDEERKSRDEVADENDWEMLKEDVGNIIASGIKEIRENVNDKQGREENLECSFSQSSVVGIKRGKKGNYNNRYCLLEEDNGEGEEEREYEILGNSEVQYMGERTKRGGRRGIYSTNGAGIVDILEHIKSKRLEGKTTVIHGGGDDIKKLETEHMLRTYKEAIRETKEKGKLCIVSGILPRRGESSYWSSRAVIIEEKVEINSRLDKRRRRENAT